ncbi:copper amine oxidase N-terminal domain-containing protein [Paenibacillus frigoriresistens]|uniref:copper amine oxidase N-terminal domain-containing protein n=1 Tax=Paenibacillus alginolyticus TaxID=59839 RepID=UPI0015661ECF|nr:copper amine oxidase N-terminal domain-containing protein [Paenibacillus frigoriresistens]NRF95050.1 copper amine oxidase N-terminal domain-containing protein [Paenibacillus frigoriresistens]
MKMNKPWMITATCIVVTSLMTGSAFAKSENGNNADKADSSKPAVELNVKVKEDMTATVTSDTYGNQGKNGYLGLLHALENVKDKPAGAVIADLLLTNYGAHISDELKAELDAIKDRDAALSAVADVLDKQGSVTDAVYVQKEAVKANLKNLNSYKKLGKLYEKLGKKGVLLYVNGEEPALEVNPFIKDGSTLVPFRAISESLKAEVTWNAEERSVTVTRGGITVKLFIDSTKATVDGKEVTLEVPAAIVEGNTVVPVRFISEALKATVKWEEETKSVVIYED